MVLVHLGVHLGLGELVHRLNEVADRPIIHLPAELYLRLDLVALGDGDVAHVVPEADDAQLVREVIAYGRAHPGAQLLEHRRVLPIARDDLARQAHTRADEAVLAVAVRGLVEVHEVHVYGFVRDAAVILRGQVAPGLLKQAQTVYPHLARGEGVAPGHYAEAVLSAVGGLHYLGNLGVGLDRGLIYQLAGQFSGGAHALRHLGGAL